MDTSDTDVPSYEIQFSEVQRGGQVSGSGDGVFP